MRNHRDLTSLQRLASRHRSLVERSDVCGCFSCLEMFEPEEIVEWVDGPAANLDAGQTALCPRCGADAVIPSAGVELSEELLADLNEYYF